MSAKIIALVACEASGDHLGAHLMRVLKTDPDLTPSFIGIGGVGMESEGLASLFPYHELSVMGLVEVVKHLPRLWARQFELRRFLKEKKPDVLITIDAPDFNKPLAKYARTQGIPCIHTVAPSVWAWRPGRAQALAKIYQHLWALLPFEPPLFQDVGLSCTYIGHPSTSQKNLSDTDIRSFEMTYGLSADTPIISLWPGSREQEIRSLLPLYLDVFRAFKTKHPAWVCMIPTLPAIEKSVRTYVAEEEACHVVPVHEQACVRLRSHIALATSGTVTLELACAKVPMVVAYRMHPLSYAVAKKCIKIPWVSLPNILLKEGVVPEIIQDDCTHDNLLQAIENMMQPEIYAQQKNALLRVADIMQSPSPKGAILDPFHKVMRKINTCSF